MLRTTGSVLLSAMVLVLAEPTVARAQSSNTALAEALFKDGRALMGQENYEEACPKFEESQRLAPKLGTLLNLATCHDKQGRTASAWDEYTRALSMAKQAGEAERVDYARAQLDELEPRLSKVSVEVAAPVQGIEVKLDGNAIGEAAWGTPVPLDPGEHELAAVADGFDRWSTTFEVPPGPNQMSVRVPELHEATGTSGGSPPDSPQPQGADSADDGSTQRILGWTVGAVGLVGVGVGVVFGISAFSTYGSSDDHCQNDICTQEGLDLRDDAQTSATISNIAIGAGAGAMVLGLVLVLTAGGGDDEGASGAAWLRPSVSTTGSGLHFGASF